MFMNQYQFIRKFTEKQEKEGKVMIYPSEPTIAQKIAKILSENEVTVDEIDYIFEQVQNYLCVHIKNDEKNEFKTNRRGEQNGISG